MVVFPTWRGPDTTCMNRRGWTVRSSRVSAYGRRQKGACELFSVMGKNTLYTGQIVRRAMLVV